MWVCATGSVTVAPNRFLPQPCMTKFLKAGFNPVLVVAVIVAVVVAAVAVSVPACVVAAVGW